MEPGMRVPNLDSLLRHVRKQGLETAETPRLSDVCEFVSPTKKLLLFFRGVFFDNTGSKVFQYVPICSMRKTPDV